MEKPRVFISSVVDGYAEMREAARAGVIAAGLKPILANEDFPSLAVSSRNACLDGIDSCDVLITIIGTREGWTAPSGKTVVEEELTHARKRKLPCLIFLEDVARDPAAERLARSASDYVSGNFRRTFRTPEELSAAVTDALRQLNPIIRNDGMSASRFDDFPSGDGTGSSDTQLNVRIAPVRAEELLSPPQMASPETERLLHEIGHSEKVGLFSYSNAKETTSGDGILTISEYSDRHTASIKAEFEEHGTIDLVLALPRPQTLSISEAISLGLVIPIEDIEATLRSAMLFYGGLLDRLDRWQRHQQFYFNVALTDLGHRTLQRAPEQRSSYSMRMPRSNATLVAYAEPRVIARSDLKDPEGEVARATVLLVRKAAVQ
jgi:hypothetical protein